MQQHDSPKYLMNFPSTPVDVVAGIHDIRVDFHQQRLTIIGWADPEEVVKAINKKARKNATICSNIELTRISSSEPTQPAEEPKGINEPAHEDANATTTTQPADQASPSSNSELTSPSQPPTPTQHNSRHHQWQNNPVGEQCHVIHHNNRFSCGHSYVDQSHRERSWHNTNSPVFLQETSQSVYVTHMSYNAHMPSSYVTEYECVRSPSWHTHHHNRVEDYQNGNVNIAAIFSDDNPNACCIV